MKRPILYILVFFILGIIAGQYATSFIDIVLFVVVSYGISFIIYKKFKFLIIMMLPIIFLTGIFLVKNSISPINMQVEKLAQNNVYTEIYGSVSSIDYTKAKRPKAVIKTKAFKINDKTIYEKIKIQVIFEKEDIIEVGQNVIIKGNLMLLEKPSNPGGYNEFLYLKTRNIQYKMFTDYLKTGKTEHNFETFTYKSREKLGEVYDTVFDEKQASILKAMIIGDKSDLDETIKELFREAGIYHILAISGLHISLIAQILMIAFNKVSKRYGKIAVLIILVFYCIFTGGSASTVRATIMVSTIIIGHLIHRTHDFLSSISTACILLLLYQPLYLFDIGFQYSFAAVYGIAILVYPISRVIKHKEIGEFISAYIAVNIVGKPIALYYFYNICFIDIFVNIIVLPFVFIIVLFGIIIGIVGLISIKIAMFFAGTVHIILNYYELVCTVAVSIPFSNVIFGKPTIMFVIICYIVIGLFAYVMYGRDEQIKKRKKYFYISLCVCSFYIIFSAVIPKQLEVTMLDVGQGDSITISKGNKNYIIDGGGNITKKLGEDKDTGINVLLPYLKYKGNRQIDAVFISHTDDDHIKGIIEIIGEIKIKKIFLPKRNFDDDMYKILIEKSKKYNIPIYEFKKGDKISIDKDTFIEGIYPTENIQNNLDKNNSSMVLKLYCKEISFLFTGDIEEEAEDIILKDGIDINCDILKLAHHGSKTSTKDEFLYRVSPEVSIVSSGKNNRYNHPSLETVEKLEKNNIPLFNTADVGAVIITTNGEKIKIRTMLGSEKYEAVKK